MFNPNRVRMPLHFLFHAPSWGLEVERMSRAWRIRAPLLIVQLKQSFLFSFTPKLTTVWSAQASCVRCRRLCHSTTSTEESIPMSILYPQSYIQCLSASSPHCNWNSPQSSHANASSSRKHSTRVVKKGDRKMPWFF